MRRLAERLRRPAIAAMLSLPLVGTSMTGGASQESDAAAVWQRPVSTAGLPRRIAIIFAQEAGELRPSSVEIPDHRPEGPREPALYPIRENLLPLLAARPFGAESRAEVIASSGTVSVVCAPGAKAAGALLSNSEHRMPRGMRGWLVLHGRAEPGFAVDHVTRGESASGMTLGPAGQLAAIPHDKWVTDEQGDIALLCPMDGGELTVTEARILPAPAMRLPRRATWIWSLEPWHDRSDALVAEARRLSLTDLFVQLDVRSGGSEAESTAELLRALQGAGISTHAVEGDPAMVTAEGRRRALDRAREIRAFRDAGAPLESVQYDIEPYLLDAYAADPAGTWRAWADTIRDLSSIHSEPIDVVVPFWMRDSESGASALHDAANAIGRAIVMVYRTDPRLVTDLAVPWLEWGSRHGIGIGIALENEMLPAERYRVYERAERGVVTMSRSKGHAILTLHAAAVAARPGLAAYAFSHETELDPARVSFLGDAGKMIETANQTAEVLQAWPTFNTLAFHQLIVTHQ